MYGETLKLKHSNFHCLCAVVPPSNVYNIIISLLDTL